MHPQFSTQGIHNRNFSVPKQTDASSCIFLFLMCVMGVVTFSLHAEVLVNQTAGGGFRGHENREDPLLMTGYCNSIIFGNNGELKDCSFYAKCGEKTHCTSSNSGNGLVCRYLHVRPNNCRHDLFNPSTREG